MIEQDISLEQMRMMMAIGHRLMTRSPPHATWLDSIYTLEEIDAELFKSITQTPRQYRLMPP